MGVATLDTVPKENLERAHVQSELSARSAFMALGGHAAVS